MALNDIHRVIVYFTNSNTATEHSFGYFLREGSGADPSVDQIGAKVKAWWNDTQGALGPVKALYDNDIALSRVTRRKINPLSAVIDQYTTGLPISGSETSAGAFNPQDSPILSYRTALSGKRYRGRSFLPPVAEDNSSGGILVTADAQLLADKTVLLMSLHESVDNMVHTVWSATGSFYNDVTAIYADRKVRTQRRRQPRGTLYLTGV